MLLLDAYMADLRRRWNVNEDGAPWDDDPPEPLVLSDDTAPAFFVRAMGVVAAERSKELRHFYADMILGDLLLFAMDTHEDGDVVAAAHEVVDKWRSFDKWYA